MTLGFALVAALVVPRLADRAAGAALGRVRARARASRRGSRSRATRPPTPGTRGCPSSPTGRTSRRRRSGSAASSSSSSSSGRRAGAAARRVPALLAARDRPRGAPARGRHLPQRPPLPARARPLANRLRAHPAREARARRVRAPLGCGAQASSRRRGSRAERAAAPSPASGGASSARAQSRWRSCCRGGARGLEAAAATRSPGAVGRPREACRSARRLTSSSMLVLRRADVQELLDLDELLEALALAHAALSAGAASLPPRIAAFSGDAGLLGAMPAYLPRPDRGWRRRRRSRRRPAAGRTPPASCSAASS